MPKITSINSIVYIPEIVKGETIELDYDVELCQPFVCSDVVRRSWVYRAIGGN